MGIIGWRYGSVHIFHLSDRLQRGIPAELLAMMEDDIARTLLRRLNNRVYWHETGWWVLWIVAWVCLALLLEVALFPF